MTAVGRLRSAVVYTADSRPKPADRRLLSYRTRRHPPKLLNPTMMPIRTTTP